MNNKERKAHTSLSQEEADKIQKYLKEISRIYGIRLAEIGEFLGKKLKNHRKGEHQWFMAFMIIDDLFDGMEKKILTFLKNNHFFKESETDQAFVENIDRRETLESIIRETQTLIKEELPLPKQDVEKDS